MSGSPWLDGAMLAVSLFNTIVLLWLGLTVILNAERRTWGIWLAGGGLLSGGAFFVSHTALLGHNLTFIGPGTEFWWRVGWIPLIALPYAWYVLMLWYAGFWTGGVMSLRRHQRPWWVAMSVIAAGLLVLLLLGHGLPAYWQLLEFDLSASLALARLPLLLAIYPVYTVACIVLALRVLAHPAPSPRVMGELARVRARSWLRAASAALLAASVLVILALVWISHGMRQNLGLRHYPAFFKGIAWFDLIIAGSIGVAVVLLGQAVVSYEIFTGRTLPRRGFFRHWRRAVILAGGTSLIAAASMVAQLRPIYSLLLSAILMIAFYALLVWRSFSDREHALAQLRPFVTSQHLYEHLLDTEMPPDVASVFEALCADVLGATAARLVPVGTAVPLVGAPLVFPPNAPHPSAPVRELVNQLLSVEVTGMALNPADYGGAVWAVPLWGERRLLGVLLLGDKADGGFYTQEEIELARAGGERLIDLAVSAEMARRLMALQRQKLVESRVVDHRTRRVLHDDVLPNLHAALLMLSAGDARDDVIQNLTETHRRVADLLRELPSPETPALVGRSLIGALRQVVAQELEGTFDRVTWHVTDEFEQHARSLPPLSMEVLFYAAREVLRNAAYHGQGAPSGEPNGVAASLSVTVGGAWQEGLVLWIEDDGKGIDPSSDATRGSGQGLALHSTLMAVVGGVLEVESTPGVGTRVTLRLSDTGCLFN